MHHTWIQFDHWRTFWPPVSAPLSHSLNTSIPLLHQLLPNPKCAFCGKNVALRQLSLPWSKLQLGAVFCISLKDRPDRFLRACNRIHEFGLCQQRVIFIRPQRDDDVEKLKYKAYTCFEAHRLACRIGIAEFANQNILVLEDDFKPLSQILQDHTALNNAAFQLQCLKKWDLFYLGAWCIGKSHFDYGNKGPVRNTHILGTQAYLANTKSPFVHRFADIPLYKWPVSQQCPVDRFFSKQALLSYTCKPMFVGQDSQLGSDIMTTPELAVSGLVKYLSYNDVFANHPGALMLIFLVGVVVLLTILHCCCWSKKKNVKTKTKK